jgi:hypothetical protein
MVSAAEIGIIGGVDTAKFKQHAAFTLQSLNQLLWPAVCINCGESICETDANLCKNCWDELLGCTGADYCPRCGKDASQFALLQGSCPDCQGKEVHFDQIARSGVYKEALQKMILAFKKGRTELDSGNRIFCSCSTALVKAFGSRL